jgi:hypothetical protein
MDNPEKLATQCTQDEDKKNRKKPHNTTIFALPIAILQLNRHNLILTSL